MHIICGLFVSGSYGSALVVGAGSFFRHRHQAPSDQVCRRSCNGFHPAQPARRRHGRVEQGHARRADRADGTPHRRERVRHPADHACDVRREDRAVHPRRLAVRVVHEGYRRLLRCRRVVDGTNRVPEGRALHDVVRSRRSGLLLRAAGRSLLPTDGFDPVLAAARHHPVATLAGPGADDQGQQQNPVRRAALRRPCRVARDRAGVRRQRANTRSAHGDRRAAALAHRRNPVGPGRARPARQDHLPGRPRRGVRRH